ncbi:hypothetical protein HXX76_007180 [Chlamydomonas incerta]|uniref:Guanylate cyclase domain-containing protein n=1 Tax=Chlamydomonas incerta TaxID=51695 RepID=A0A835T376_CHLIN|nr:hypothetical protein HXX76_007180 [Chlamydomonas incerta]|eukprot:KAG2435093.1 hypothetical protein HXX76_007180 [Chlamydomonas incerta]
MVALEATPHAVTVVALGGSCPGAVLYQNALSRSYFGNRCTADPAGAGLAASRVCAPLPPPAAGVPPQHGGGATAPNTPASADRQPMAVSRWVPAPGGGASHSGAAGPDPDVADGGQDGVAPSVLPPILLDLFSLCPEKLQGLARELVLLEPVTAGGDAAAARGGAGGGAKSWKSVILVPASCGTAPPLAAASDALAAMPTLAAARPVYRQQPAPSLQPWVARGEDADQLGSIPNVFNTDAALQQAPCSQLLLMPAQQGPANEQPQRTQHADGSKATAAAHSVAVAVSAVAAVATAAAAHTAVPGPPAQRSAPLGHVPLSHSLGQPLPQHHTQGSISRTLYPADVHRDHQQQVFLSQPAQPHQFSDQQLPLPVQVLTAADPRHPGSGSSLPPRYHSQQDYSSSQHASVTNTAPAHASGVAGSTFGGTMPTGHASAAYNTASTAALSAALATSTIALAIEQQPGLASAITHSLPLGGRPGAQQVRGFATASGMLSGGFSGPMAAASLDGSQPLFLVGQPWDEQAPGGQPRSRLLASAAVSGGEAVSPSVTGEHASGGGQEAAPGGERGGSSAVLSAKERALLPPPSERLAPGATPRASLIGIPELGSFHIDERGDADGGRGAAAVAGSGAAGQQQGAAPDEDRFNSWLKFMMKAPLPDQSVVGAVAFARQLQQHHQHHHQQQPQQQPLQQQQGMPRQHSDAFSLWPAGGGIAGLTAASGQLPQARRPRSFQGRDAAGASSPSQLSQLPAPVVPNRSMNGSAAQSVTVAEVLAASEAEALEAQVAAAGGAGGAARSAVAGARTAGGGHSVDASSAVSALASGAAGGATTASTASLLGTNANLLGTDAYDGGAVSTTGELSNLMSECAAPGSELSVRTSSKLMHLRLPAGNSQNGAHASIGSRSSQGGSWDGYGSTQDSSSAPADARTRGSASEAYGGGSSWKPFVDVVPEVAEATVSIPADAEETDATCEARGAWEGQRGSDQSNSLAAVPAAAWSGTAAPVESAAVAPTAGTSTAVAAPTMWEAVVAAASAAAAGGVTPLGTEMRLESVQEQQQQQQQSLLLELAPAAAPKSSSSGGVCISTLGEPSLAVPRFAPAEALLTVALRSSGGHSGGATVSGQLGGLQGATGVTTDNPHLTRLRAAGGSVGAKLDLMERTSNGSGGNSGPGSETTGAGCPSSLFCATLNQFPSGAVGPAGMSTSGHVGTSISGSGGPQRNRLLASAMATLDLSIHHAGAKPPAAQHGQPDALRVHHGRGTSSQSGESSQPGTPGLMSPLAADPARQRPPPAAAAEPPAAPHLELDVGLRAPSTGYASADPSVRRPYRPRTASGNGGGAPQHGVAAGAGSQVLLDGSTGATHTASVTSTSGVLGVGPGERMVMPVSVDVARRQQHSVRLEAGAAPSATAQLAVLRAASAAEPSGGFVYVSGAQSAALTAALGRGGADCTYHRVMATVQPEPAAGGRVLVIMQTDVSAKVAAESHAILVAERQHRLLEQIYPHHVLAALTEQLVAQQSQHTQVLQAAREAVVVAEAAAVRAAAAADREATRALFQPGWGQDHLRQMQAQLFVAAQQAHSSAFATSSGALDALEAHYTADGNAPRAACGPVERTLSRDAGRVSTTADGAARAAVDAAGDAAVAAEDAAAAAQAAAVALQRLERRAGLILQNPPAFTGHGELARFHPQVTVLFADIKGFTALCKDIEPETVMRMLNDLFSRFDNLLDRFALRKMDTIGDGYVAAGGLTHAESDSSCGVVGAIATGNASYLGPHAAAPDATGTDAAHAPKAAGAGGTTAVAGDVVLPSCPSFTARFSPPQAARAVFRFAQAMLRAAEQVLLPTTGRPVQIRIGIATGPVVSGVVGATKPKYSLFGDTVHAANWLESAGEAGAIHVSSATYALLVADSQHPPQGQPPRQQLLQPMDGGRWSSTAAGMQLRGGGPVEATFMWTPNA